MKELNTDVEFQQTIAKGTVLVDFFATWCGPCKMLAPELEKVEIVNIVKADVDKLPVTTSEYGIMSVPTLMLFKDGQLVAQKSGYMPHEVIEQWVSSQLD